VIHTEVTPTEQAGRLAIRELVDAYAHRADRRLAEQQPALFTEDTHFIVFMEGQGTEPTQVLDGRESLTPVFDDLNRYQATQHFNGQSTVWLDGDRRLDRDETLSSLLTRILLAHCRTSRCAGQGIPSSLVNREWKTPVGSSSCATRSHVSHFG
jgi:hypothetical protein